MLLRKKSIIGSLEFKRMLNGCFGVARAQEILEEIFFKMLLRKKYCGFAVYLQIKSLTKIIDQNTLEFLAFGKGFIMDRIGDARNLN